MREASFESAKTGDNNDDYFHNYYYKAMDLANGIESQTAIEVFQNTKICLKNSLLLQIALYKKIYNHKFLENQEEELESKTVKLSLEMVNTRKFCMHRKI